MPTPGETQARYIAQPAVARLKLPAQFVPRFDRITERLESRQRPWPRHIAAAVLYDEAGEQPDAALADLAQALSAGATYTYDHPGTPLVTLSRASLRAGRSAPNNGLFIKNSNVPSMFQTPVAVMACESSMQADIYGSFIGKAELVPRQEEPKPSGARHNVTAYVTPHVVTPHTLERAAPAAENFLSEQRGGVVAIGGTAIAEFFQALANPAAEAEHAELKQQLAALATGFLAEQEFNFEQSNA